MSESGTLFDILSEKQTPRSLSLIAIFNRLPISNETFGAVARQLVASPAGELSLAASYRGMVVRAFALWRFDPRYRY